MEAPNSSHIMTLIALDVTFAMATGMTGIHGLIVDWGADIGDVLNIDPWFDAHAGHDHGPIATSTGTTDLSSQFDIAHAGHDYIEINHDHVVQTIDKATEIPEGCHYDIGSDELHCSKHKDTISFE